MNNEKTKMKEYLEKQIEIAKAERDKNNDELAEAERNLGISQTRLNNLEDILNVILLEVHN
jgi:hypothetical protein